MQQAITISSICGRYFKSKLTAPQAYFSKHSTTLLTPTIFYDKSYFKIKAIMKYKILPFLISSILLTTTAYADQAFNGFYVGTGLGGSQLQSKQLIDAQTPYIDNSNHWQYGVTASPVQSNNSFSGNIDLGYGRTWQNFYFGAEGFINASSHQLNFNQQNDLILTNLITDVVGSAGVNNNLKTSPLAFGIDLRPGYVIAPNTLLYGKIGAVYSHISWESNLTNLTEIGGDPLVSVPLNLSTSTTRLAYQFGLGLERYMTNDLSLRLEYTYTDYGRLSVNGSTNFIDGVTQLQSINSSNVLVTDSSVMLGMNYYFDRLNSLTDSGQSTLADIDWNGFYIGGGVGAGRMQTHQSVNVGSSLGSTSGDLESYPINSNADEADSHAAGSLYFGYGRAWQSFYLGAEAFAEGVGASSSGSNYNDYISLLPGNSNYFLSTENDVAKVDPLAFGIALRPGYLISPSTLLYAKVGAMLAHTSWQVNATGSGSVSGQAWSIPYSLSDSSTHLAYQLGLGVEQYLTNKISLRLEYAFTDYGTFSLNGSTSGPRVLLRPTSVSINAHNHLVDNSLMLGLSYHFGS
ncbi:MAG: hypothetical protein K0Q57_308 [Gammaproteobacteria bacterium]|jgi:opacity protein-like surface antigen|nr:hypothetical protein [Gammaproteobacteria bacterium]